MKSNQILFTLIALIGFTVSREATAGTNISCTVQSVEWNSTPRLLVSVTCGSATNPRPFYAYVANPSPSCPLTNIDIVKIWEGIFRAALLSKKKVDIDFLPSPPNSCDAAAGQTPIVITAVRVPIT